jgi:hypothetical protein
MRHLPTRSARHRVVGALAAALLTRRVWAHPPARRTPRARLRLMTGRATVSP